MVHGDYHIYTIIQNTYTHTYATITYITTYIYIEHVAATACVHGTFTVRELRFYLLQILKEQFFVTYGRTGS